MKINYWTTQDEKLLRQHAKKTPVKIIRKKLSSRRSASAIYQKARDLGISLSGGRIAA